MGGVLRAWKGEEKSQIDVFSYLVKAPKTDAAVMLVTVGIVVATNDLSKGVIAGVILSAIFFVAKISKIQVTELKTDATAMIVTVGSFVVV